jgi:pimeloyl-ACP methyl ester carboxylesterase
VGTARRVATIASLGKTDAIGAKPIRRVQRLGPVGRLFSKMPAPSERTRQLLRRMVLDDQYRMEPDAAILRLKTQAEIEPGLELTHAVAELAWRQGEWASRLGQTQRANRMYATALESAYRFLFDPDLDLGRNAYDPQFRSISDIYNKALEAILRDLIADGQLVPGRRIILQTIDSEIAFDIDLPGRWKNQAIERFEIVSDFEVRGLANQYHTFGLGVPLIAVRSSGTDQPLEEHYPPGLTLALTAFLQLDSRDSRDPYATLSARGGESARLSLFDPLEQTWAQVGNRMVPLESDITTPMARYLNDPLLNTNVFATLALINADFANDFAGLYMLEPFDPNKIPVVMIHGLWSSPVTWLQMFNDLRADRAIHEHCQFWFCLYPTGQPWWDSAQQIRDQLREVRAKYAPAGTSPGGPLDQMVLVGHSMGGLVARLQTIESDDRFWRVISEQSPESFEGDPEVLTRLRDTFFFEPNPSVRHLITIATPHGGSDYANDTTRWLGRKVITLPSTFTDDWATLVSRNRERIVDDTPLTVSTSIDSLSPENPFFEMLANSPAGPGLISHNIYGNVRSNRLAEQLGLAEAGDGVVTLESARLAGAESEIEIGAEHNTIHQHPRTVLEVKRILLEHLARLDRLDGPPVVRQVSASMLEPLPAVRPK